VFSVTRRWSRVALVEGDSARTPAEDPDRAVRRGVEGAWMPAIGGWLTVAASAQRGEVGAEEAAARAEGGEAREVGGFRANRNFPGAFHIEWKEKQ
jgi:hypothetical protein